MTVATPAFSTCYAQPSPSLAAAVARAQTWDVASPPTPAPPRDEAQAPVAEPAPVAKAAAVPSPVAIAHTIGPGKRLHAEGLPDVDRNCAIAMHLSPFSFVWIGPLAMAIPLIIWAARRNRTAFHDDHGREITNFMISFLVMHVLLAITFIGIPLIPVYWVVSVVSLIRGAVAAGKGEYFRYPVTMRFLK